MLRNYIATALRHISRNRLYAAINILGLAVGFAAGMLAMLFVRDEVTFNRWIPGYERTYTLASTVAFIRGVPPNEQPYVYRDVAKWLELDFSEVESAARMRGYIDAVVSRGDTRAFEQVATADPNFFQTVPLPAIAGDLQHALESPDAVVLTRAMARKYFGRDRPLGETLEIDQHSLIVRAVIEDIPTNTYFPGSSLTTRTQIFTSGQAPFSPLYAWDRSNFSPETEPFMMLNGGTFLRLKPGADPEALNAAMPDFVRRHLPAELLGKVEMRLLPMGTLHLAPIHNSGDDLRRARLLNAIYGTVGIGFLIVLAATLNFINATTARAVRRAVEVGVRKTTGATRAHLVVQFIGEALTHTLIAAVLALSLVAILMPEFRALLGRSVGLDLWHEQRMTLGLGVAVLVIGALAGVYPGLVLSAFRPAAVLRASRIGPSGSALVRTSLIVAQFAILIGVTTVTFVVHRQSQFAINESLRFDRDQVVAIQTGCVTAFMNSVRALPNVRAATCGDVFSSYQSVAVAADGTALRGSSELLVTYIDGDFFRTFGLEPIAGRTISDERGEDVAAPNGLTNPNVMINESAAHKLGFPSAQAAIGATVQWRRWLPSREAIDTRPLLPSRIVGVLLDLPTNIQWAEPAQIYYIDPTMAVPNGAVNHPGANLTVKLSGLEVSEALAQIDRLWTETVSAARPIRRRFLDQQIEELYRDLTTEAEIIGAFTAVAIFVAGLGLFGLASFTAEQRTKEIGIRKAMGASKAEILRLVVWDLTKPVLLANLFAWPVAALAMQRWLEGFAYHVNLEPWMFLVASGFSIAIGLVTVIGHALAVTRARPVSALRYE